MTRSELIAALSDRFPQFHYKDAELSVATILDGIADTLKAGERVEIRGFGSFILNHRRPRMGRNPRTGARVEVPAKWIPHFKAGLWLRQWVDN